MTKLLIALPCAGAVKEQFLQEFSEDYEILFAQGDPDIIARELKTAEVVIGEPSPELLCTAQNLKWLQITWAGADRFTKDFPAHVTLTNASGAFGRVISEYTLGMILSQYKQLPKYYVNQKSRTWAMVGGEKSLMGRRVLILGTGDLGSSIAQKLHAFGTFNVGVNRRGIPAAHFDEICTPDRLDALLPQADIIIGALPKTPATQGLLDRRRLMLMKEDALLVNVGRGNLIVTKDLEQVLCEGHLGGVCLDVVDPEPLPRDSSLWSCDRVLLTPHVSGISFGQDPATEAAIWEICMANLRRYKAGHPLNNLVNPQAGY